MSSTKEEVTEAAAAGAEEMSTEGSKGQSQPVMGLYGLGVMGQNYALNVASKGFKIAVCNRSSSKVDTCVARAKKEKLSEMVVGRKEVKAFVSCLEKPRRVMFLVKAGPTVDTVIETLSQFMEKGDVLIDGGTYSREIQNIEREREW